MYVLKAAQALTGRSNESIPHCAVLIDGGVILEIRNQNEIQVPLHAEIVDLKQCTLLPGLIDSHVHLALDASADPVGHFMSETADGLLKRMEINAKTLIESGVTTARDMGAKGYLEIEIRDRIEKGILPGPHLLTSGEPITTQGGHCWFLGVECNDTDSIQAAVRENIRHGTDWLKIMASGGMMTKGSAAWICQYPLHEMEAAVSEAHRAGKRIASHAHSRVAIENSVDAGVDTIEHCSWITPTGYQFDPPTAEKMVRKNIMICSTTSRAWKQAKARMGERYKNAVLMRKMGVKFIAGTDAGIMHAPFDAYVDGLEVLSELGFSNYEVIEAATHLAAIGCGIADQTGCLAPGKSADLIAVDGNPLERLNALRQVVMVMKSGNVVTLKRSPRSDL
jgi:imidazolonepropionase-like amidohydrolase